MKKKGKFFVLFFLSYIFAFEAICQNHYEINLKVKGTSETNCILTYYSGNKKIIIDTSVINSKGIFHFQKAKPLPGGIYQMQFPNDSYFEFISDGRQEAYEMSSDASDLQLNLKVAKSDENKLFLDYLKTVVKYKSKYGNDFDNKIREYVNEVISENSSAFVARYLMLVYNTNNKSSFLNNFNFADARFIRTKIFSEQINYYLDKLLPQTSDELIKGTALVIDKSKADAAVYQYVASILLEKYEPSETNDYKQVFISIAKKYYLSKQAGWVSDEDLLVIEGLVDKKQFEVAKSQNEIYGYSNYLSDFPNGKYIVEARDALEQLKFNAAKSTNTVSSYQQYLSDYPNGTFVTDARIAIEDLKFNTAVKNNNISSFEGYLKEYPDGKYKTESKNNIERLKFENAQKINTLNSYNSYLAEYPNGKYKTDAANGITMIQNKEKEAELKLIAEKKQKEWEAKMKMEEEQRIQELDKAASEGVDALVKFADKWPNTEESKQALRILAKYGAENNTLEKKIYVEDAFFWVADGDRSWLNELYESNRNWMKGGEHYNLFVFAKLHNRSKEKLRIQAFVNLNLIKTSHISIFSNTGENILTASYLMEIQPGESKGLVVMFQNIGSGSEYGSGWLSAGSSQGLNTSKPFDIYFKYYNSPIPQGTLKAQQDMINTLLKNNGNIKITRSGKDILAEKLDSWLGINSDNYADLYVYFQKKSSGDETLTISDPDGKVIKEDVYSSTGQKNESYNLPTNKNYKVYVPGYGEYSVYVKRRLTHLIIDSKGGKKVTYDE